MAKVTAHSVFRIGSANRPRLEDYAADRYIEETPGGLTLQVALVCDGVGSADWGVRASKLTGDAIIEFIETSEIENVPQLMKAAIQFANLKVLDEIPNGQGNTTVALTVVDLTNTGKSKDSENYGTLYIASVGDSPIFLIRDEKLIRLNTDHNVANEKFLRGEITEDQIPYVDKGTALTRAIGLDEDLEVDIGIYAWGANLKEAAKRGKAGMALKQHDTVFACSDGLVETNPNDGLPFVHDEQFYHHAIDRNVELAANTLVSYAEARGPLDNVSISLLFVDGPKRRDRGAIGGGISTRTRIMIAVAMLVLILAGVGAVLIVNSRSEAEKVALNQTATFAVESANARATEAANMVNATATVAQETLVAANQTATISVQNAEGTANAVSTINAGQARVFVTQTAIALIPTATPTPRPQVASQNSVGVVFVNNTANVGVEEGTDLTLNQPSYLTIDGGAARPAPAYIYSKPGTTLNVDRIRGDSMELLVSPASELFVQSNEYSYEGVTLTLNEDKNVSFISKKQSLDACVSMRYETLPEPDNRRTVIFACYGNGSICEFSGGSGNTLTIDGGQQLRWDVGARTFVSAENQQFFSEIGYQGAFDYYKWIVEMRGEQSENAAPQCLIPLVDSDGDELILDDACPESSGSRASRGCAPTPTPTPGFTSTPIRPTNTLLPDKDFDGVTDASDHCADQPGPPNTNGCPDGDGDGIADGNDTCANEWGSPSAGGCPDRDGDSVPDSGDTCADQSGSPNTGGCPDSDGDNIADKDDGCANEWGGPITGGCPDNDGDNIADKDDACPTEGGLPKFGGCPKQKNNRDSVNRVFEVTISGMGQRLHPASGKRL